MAKLRIEVVRALPGHAERMRLELEPGATVGTALRAAGHAVDAPAGLHGRRVPPGTPLEDGDRVELYRPLRVDPKEARRERARRRRR
jgi:putative ubiquitin-RnfH superfamily antitoxin RatB of RatAB toxin-antitoxin module